MSKSFQFKKFTIHQDRCAMKIGTDGVLLGAWVPLDHNIHSILDIGTGTGVIGLMLAQRSAAGVIDGIEIDADAYEQAVENFESSLWGDRLFCYHASFQEFVVEMDEEYDLIITNPPFFTENFKTQDKQRDLARFEDALPFEHIIGGSVQLLSESGKVAMIIPYKEEERLLKLANQAGLFPERITRVKGTPSTEIKRSLLLLSFESQDPIIDTLIIEKERHQYTQEYMALTSDFYLKM